MFVSVWSILYFCMFCIFICFCVFCMFEYFLFLMCIFVRFVFSRVFARFFVLFVVWGVDSLSFFCIAAPLVFSLQKAPLCVFVIKKHSEYLVRTSEEESGYKKCCTRFVLEPRIGRSSSARTSAAAAAEGEQHRVQQQRAAAARFG